MSRAVVYKGARLCAVRKQPLALLCVICSGNIAVAVLPLKPRYVYIRLNYLEAEFAILDIVGVSAVLELCYYSVAAYRYGDISAALVATPL